MQYDKTEGRLIDMSKEIVKNPHFSVTGDRKSNVSVHGMRKRWNISNLDKMYKSNTIDITSFLKNISNKNLLNKWSVIYVKQFIIIFKDIL